MKQNLDVAVKIAIIHVLDHLVWKLSLVVSDSTTSFGAIQSKIIY